MPDRVELPHRHGVALGHVGQDLLGLVIIALIHSLDVRGQEAREEDRAPGRREDARRDHRQTVAPRRTDTVSPRASTICDATVRCQIISYSLCSELFSSPRT